MLFRAKIFRNVCLGTTIASFSTLRAEEEGFVVNLTDYILLDSWTEFVASAGVITAAARRGISDELIRTPDALLFAHLASRGVIRATAIKLKLRFDRLKSADRY